MNLCHVNTSNQSALEALQLKLHVSRAGSVNLSVMAIDQTAKTALTEPPIVNIPWLQDKAKDKRRTSN
ncbi:hypothetical protein D6C99_10209 [Aureobasidium pullulans]|nr:hypothetical protein D6C99_10209 [Aureobasidium pullulans]